MSNNLPAFLLDDFIVENGQLGHIPPAALDPLRRFAAKIRGDAALRNLAARWSHELFGAERPTLLSDAFPERVEGLAEPEVWAFRALLALSGFPFCRELFASRGLPPELAEGATVDLSLWLEQFQRELGMPGIPNRILGWEHGLLHGSFYRLGRLQFGVRPFGGNIVVFRHRQTRQAQALASDGLDFNPEGFRDGVDGDFAGSGAWTSSLVLDGARACGNPITPAGRAENRMVELPLDVWEKVLGPGDFVLDTHIPAGESLSVESCADAFARAVEFHHQHFPKANFKAFCCISWFLDPQYQQLLKPESNILKFQRAHRLFPVGVGGEDACWRIFGENGLKNGLAQAPRDTSMRRAVAEFLEKGGKLRSGGGFVLLEDLPFGKAPLNPAGA